MVASALKLPRPCLCLVTDRKLCQDRSLEEKVEQAVSGGVNMVQLRERDLLTADLYNLATRLREATKGKALLAINDRVDLALAVGADAVHLPEKGLPVKVARRLAGRRMLVGRSVHSVEGAVEAEADGADYLTAGTIFETGSHPGETPAGAGLVESIKARVSIPILAIGGINTGNMVEVIRAGADGVAVISAVLGAPDPEASAKRLIEAMKAAIETGPVMGGTR